MTRVGSFDRDEISGCSCRRKKFRIISELRPGFFFVKKPEIELFLFFPAPATDAAIKFYSSHEIKWALSFVWFNKIDALLTLFWLRKNSRTELNQTGTLGAAKRCPSQKRWKYFSTKHRHQWSSSVAAALVRHQSPWCFHSWYLLKNPFLDSLLHRGETRELVWPHANECFESINRCFCVSYQSKNRDRSITPSFIFPRVKDNSFGGGPCGEHTHACELFFVVFNYISYKM